jgi:benzoylformate decarboxylase|tara:strand:- start:45 stop:1688 length:1644 start_codon:yes stop_codon:yes gene_type:complete
MEALSAHGVDAIFGNPGTTENPLLDRLADFPDIHYYVALHEGVAVTAASFYAQATGKTTLANVHVAPGLGNAIGSIYGALKANSPLIVTAGAQDTRMRLRDPLLGHDLVAMAEPVTKWSAQPASADEIGPMLRRAVKIAHEPPAGPVFLALPIDVMEQETECGVSVSGYVPGTAHAARSQIQTLAELLLAANDPCIVAGDDVARSGAVAVLVRLAQSCGARVYQEGLRGQLPFPNQHPCFRGRVAFEANSIHREFAETDLVVLIGGPFFEEVWHDAASPFPEHARIVQLEDNAKRLGHNFALDLAVEGSLPHTLSEVHITLTDAADPAYRTRATERLQRLEAQYEARRQTSMQRLEKLTDERPIAPAWAVAEIARNMPSGTIVVDESITASLEVGDVMEFREPGDYYAGRGGGIGQGVAGAVGVQAAHPDRRVLAISGDGSAMYNIQALWSAAHHDLPIVFVIVSNREYRVLKHNLDIYRHRFDIPSNKPYPHMDLTRPLLGFTDMARGMGVEARTIEDPTEIGDAVIQAFAAGVPYLLDLVVSGKP